MEEQFYTIVLRHDTSTKWLVNDPILSFGEYGVEDDTHKVKRGDGESKWSELVYEDFGLKYIVTFANLHGELKDNQILTNEFEKKLSKNIFNDVNNSVVTAISITNDSEENLGRITKVVKEIELGGTTTSNLIISSSDNSIQGIWAVDELGARTLNLKAKATINDYEAGRTYHRDYICYYGNKLYRAVETFVAEETFEPRHWALLASLHSSDIKYDNLSSGLDAENVKDALDELKRRDDRKVTKSSEERVVYGTDALGQQTVIPIDDLRKVDTVNHKQADINKNVQLDANEIKYSDANPELGTIRGVLDGKVDKTFAGQGAKIVRDITTEYDAETGHIVIIEDKVSPADGTSATETREIDVVSEQELANNVETINNRITQEVSDLNSRVDDEVDTLNTRIDGEVLTLNNTITTKETEIYARIDLEHNEINSRVDNEVNTLNSRITQEVSDLNDRIDDEVTTLNTTITTKETALYNKIAEEHDEINNRVDEEVATLNTTINTKEAALQAQIDTNASEIERVEAERIAEDTRIETASQERDTRIETESQERDTTLDEKIDSEVETLNETIDTKEATLNSRITNEVNTLNATITTKETNINNRITQEVNTLNSRIADEVDGINDRIDEEVATLNTTINTKDAAMDNKKIDKAISEFLVTSIEAASDSQEPTLKVVRKNTTTHSSVVTHLHFKPAGRMITRFLDADHIQIDSSNIDAIDDEQNRRLGIAEGRLDTHDTNIASLQEHDLNHDRILATHTEQIADHETRILTLEDDVDNLENDLADEVLARTEADTGLSDRITTNATNIANHETRLTTAEQNIVNLDAKIDDEITDRTTADANLATRIADNAVRISNNTQSIRDNADSIDQLAQTVATSVAGLADSKVDKVFAEDIGDKIVGTLESDTLTGNELFNLKETMISPVDGTTTIERIKFISSDGTVVATRSNDGTIDLATNLDTDVNYFVTTDIISTTIAAETTLDTTHLTATDKQTVEVQDIISDPEGTWGRVKSVNAGNHTCVVVTFKKHAQAVWGTIKGDIADQTDLQTQLGNIQSTLQDNIDAEASARSTADTTLQDNIDAEASARSSADTTLQGNIDTVQSNLTSETSARTSADTTLQDNIDAEATARSSADTTLQGNIDTEVSARTSADTTLQGNIDTVQANLTAEISARTSADTTLQNNIDAEATARANADNNKVDKTSSANKVYGTDENGAQTTYDKTSFGKVDTVNNVQPDNAKNVTIGTGDIASTKLDGTSSTLATVITELQTLVTNLKADLTNQIREYIPDTSYTASGNYATHNFVTFVRDDGVMLMARVLRNFTADNLQTTDYECFEYDINHGNLKLIGIPEQSSPEAEEAYGILNDLIDDGTEYEGLGGTKEEIEEIFDDILGTSESEGE